MEFYQGWEIVLVGHSNGCDVICDTLKLNPNVQIHELHLISAACEADFEKNGINAIKASRVVIYIATKDKALKLATLKPARWLGYGVLGKTGPANVRLGQRLSIFEEEEFGHSDWFSDTNFDTTMDLILGFDNSNNPENP